MTFAQFMAEVKRCVKKHKGMRKGQAISNLLHEHKPGLAWRIQNTSIDPFYKDVLIPACLIWLEEHWEDE